MKENFFIENKLDTTSNKLFLLEQAEELAEIGSWSYRIDTKELYWSIGMYNMLKRSPCEKIDMLTCATSYINNDKQFDFLEFIKNAIYSNTKEISYQYELKINDELKWFELKGKVLENEFGEKQQVVGTLQDLTSLKSKSVELERLNKALDQVNLKNKQLEELTFIASHDLQEPIKTIISFATILKTKYSDKFDEKGKKYLGFLLKATNRMSNQVKAMLDYSVLGIGNSKTEICCDNILKEVLEDLSLLISETNTQIEWENAPIIVANQSEIHLLFQNLISNAIKFSKPNLPPKIQINFREDKQYWIFSVADNGIGMEQKYLKEIFSMFKRLHLRKNYKGIGIGLTQCAKIVDLHEGEIWVESTPGSGSIFYFTIQKPYVI